LQDWQKNMASFAQLMSGANQMTEADRLAREKFDFEKMKYASGLGPSSSDVLAARKFQYEMAQDRAGAEKAARTLQAYRDMLSGGGYREGTDAILGMIEAEGARSSGEVNKAYQTALANIAEGYKTAEGLTGRAYGGLESYLQQNPNNPYANVQVSSGTAPDALEQLLSAYGVSAQPVQAQVAAEQMASQQGAAGFQNLLNTLGGVAQQSDLSRMAEMQMAKALAGETLGTQRATYSSQAEQAQAQALAAIQAQLAQARIEQEIAAQNRRQQIQDAIAAAGGTVPSTAKQDDKKDDQKKEDGKTEPPVVGETEDDKRRKEELARLVAMASATGNMGYLAQPTLGWMGME
jgi:hypothetical protein